MLDPDELSLLGLVSMKTVPLLLAVLVALPNVMLFIVARMIMFRFARRQYILDFGGDATGLAGGRWAPTLFAGSLGGAAQACNARHFFGGVRCEPLDYTPAADAWSAGCDPMAMAVPMHASYESKAGVPDRVFGDLDDRAYDLQVASWVGFLSERAVGVPSVVHLHHLTPMHAAVRRVWPRVPLITHLHGTELKMLAAIRDDPLDLECGRYGVAWATRMQSWAGRSDRVVVVSATDHALALDLLPLDPGRVVTIASGVDTDVFEPKVRAWSERLALWRIIRA